VLLFLSLFFGSDLPKSTLLSLSFGFQCASFLELTKMLWISSSSNVCQK
jgi:hypothetical protein